MSNTPSTTIFTGFSFPSLIDTCNILNIFDSICLTATPQNHSTTKTTFTARSNDSYSDPPDASHLVPYANILFDFESESDLKRLDWECHKWFELSEENVTSGKHSLKVSLPPGQYPGINFEGIRKDWSNSKCFKMDIFNPSEEDLRFHIRIDDNKSGWEYANRFDKDFGLKQGIHHISIPTDSIKTNIHHRPLNLKKIKRMIVFIPNNSQLRELYIDNIRLE